MMVAVMSNAELGLYSAGIALLLAILGGVWKVGVNTGSLKSDMKALFRNLDDTSKDLNEHLRWHMRNRKLP